MMARKIDRLWLHYTVGSHRNPRAWISALHLALVIASAIGIVAGLWRQRSAELVLIAAILLCVTALNAVLVSEARHNLAVMPILMAGGAAGWAIALRRGRSQS